MKREEVITLGILGTLDTLVTSSLSHFFILELKIKN